MTPRSPGPPNQPKTFWAPWAKKITPSTTRTMSSGREAKVPRSMSMTLTSWTGRAMREPPRHIPCVPGADASAHRADGRLRARSCQVFQATGPTLVVLESRGPSRKLFGRHVLDVRGDVPDVAEWILESAVPITVELILHWPNHLGTGGDRLARQRIDPFDVEVDADGGAADGSRASSPEIRELIGEHDHGIANGDLGVSDFSARIAVAHQLDRAERLLVKVEGGRGIVDDQIRRDRGVAFRDGPHALAHCSPPCARNASTPPRRHFLR